MVWVVKAAALSLYPPPPAQETRNPLKKYRRLGGIPGRAGRIRKTSHQSVASLYADYAIIREESRSNIGYYPD